MANKKCNTNIIKSLQPQMILIECVVQMNNEVCLMLLMHRLDERKRMIEIVQANIIKLSIAAHKHKINNQTVVT